MRKATSSDGVGNPRIGLVDFYPKEALGLSQVDEEMIQQVAKEISERLRRRESNRKE